MSRSLRPPGNHGADALRPMYVRKYDSDGVVHWHG